jgi:hypothetical protein
MANLFYLICGILTFIIKKYNFEAFKPVENGYGRFATVFLQLSKRDKTRKV